ncbi:MAG TPA: ATP-binding cassette domain-containing protein, partial [Nevskiaceae bacterium]
MSDEVLLAARGLRCTVAGTTLWRDLDVELTARRCLAVTGPSGGGKTLLLRTLAGLRGAERGEIRFAGRSLREWWVPGYRAQVAYLPQRPAFPEGDVAAALTAPFAFRVHRQRRFSSERARQLIERLGMEPSFLKHATAELSGGEAQLAALVRALLVEPAILLLDEPTASLDAERAARVEALLCEWLRAGEPRACAWTSHDAAQLERVGDTLLRIGET